MNDGGKPATLLETYLLQREPLKRFLIARTGSESEAEDLVQEIYFRLDREPADGTVLNPSAYLYKMALNLALDHRRERQRTMGRDSLWAESRRVTMGSEAIADLPAADTAYEAKQRLNQVVAALDELSPQCRRVFVMHRFEGLSHPQISQRAGISRSTVEKHMATALKHLIKRLGRS